MTEVLDREIVGGPDDIVDVDETHMFTNKYYRGLPRQTWSFSCMSRLTKKAHMELIPTKNVQTLDSVAAHRQPGSYIMSEMHRAYQGIQLRLNMAGH